MHELSCQRLRVFESRRFEVCVPVIDRGRSRPETRYLVLRLLACQAVPPEGHIFELPADTVSHPAELGPQIVPVFVTHHQLQARPVERIPGKLVGLLIANCLYRILQSSQELIGVEQLADRLPAEPPGMTQPQ